MITFLELLIKNEEEEEDKRKNQEEEELNLLTAHFLRTAINIWRGHGAALLQLEYWFWVHMHFTP